MRVDFRLHKRSRFVHKTHCCSVCCRCATFSISSSSDMMVGDMDVIDLCDSDDEDRKPAAVVHYDDVQVVDAPEPPSNPMETCPTANATLGTASDLTVIGTVNQVKLPHMRQHCPEFPIGRDPTPARYCDCCYCYVCDVPVKECNNWTAHCWATDEGPQANYYKRQRLDTRNKTTPSAANSIIPNLTSPCHTLPSAASVSPTLRLISKECQHCSFQGNSLSTLWCSGCGRVWHQQPARQGVPYTRKKGDVFLGNKEIRFRLHPHDPRKITKMKDAWAQNEGKPGWVYDEQEIAEEMFRSRIGERPLLSNLLVCMPILRQLPTDGCIIAGDRQPYSYHSPAPHKSKLYAIEELQALVLENPKDKDLLIETYRLSSIFGDCNSNDLWINGDITASFDKQIMSGVSGVQYLYPVPSLLSRVSFCINRPSHSEPTYNPNHRDSMRDAESTFSSAPDFWACGMAFYRFRSRNWTSNSKSDNQEPVSAP